MRGFRLYIIVGSVLLIIYVVAQLNRPKAINWAETLNNKDKIPFGTYILYDRLKDIFPNSHITPYRKPVYNVIAEDSVKNSSYIIICQGADFAKPDYDVLTEYIKKGNEVFIGAEYFGKEFDKKFKIQTSIIFRLLNKNTAVKFVNPSLDSGKYLTVDKGAGDVYFDKFDTLKAVVLGENREHKANFIRYNIGKGKLYLAVNPKLYSNYSILNPDGARYAATALSYLKNTKQLIWDEYYTQADTGEDSPMRVFLSSDTLQWAYYITIFSLLVFVLFEVKRRQRIIPVIEPLTNSTLEFVTVVGQVYYEKRNNLNIAHKKILYLFEHLREDYQLKTNKLDDEFVEKFAAKCGIERSFASELVNYVKYINAQEHVNDRELIELNRFIEQFYIQSS